MRGLAIAVCLLGCDSLAGKDYVGEPLFTLTGSFTATSVAPDQSVGGLALMWQDPVGAGGPGVAATAVPVAITFPSTFKVDVPSPPPDATKFSFADSDVQLAEAYVYVVVDPKAPRLVPAGADRAHVLIYASADVAAGTLAADYLGGPVSAGYHLRAFTPVTTPGAAQQQMIARCVSVAAACQTRRAYQLAPVADDAPLRIAVTPP